MAIQGGIPARLMSDAVLIKSTLYAMAFDLGDREALEAEVIRRGLLDRLLGEAQRRMQR